MDNKAVNQDVNDRMEHIWHSADEFHNGNLTGKQASSEIRGTIEPLVLLKHAVRDFLGNWHGDGESQAAVNSYVNEIRKAVEWDDL